MFGRNPHSSYHMPLNRIFLVALPFQNVLHYRFVLSCYIHFLYTYSRLHSFFFCIWSCRSFSRFSIEIFFIHFFFRSTYRYNRFMHPFILIYYRWSKKRKEMKKKTHSQNRITCSTKNKTNSTLDRSGKCYIAAAHGIAFDSYAYKYVYWNIL